MYRKMCSQWGIMHIKEAAAVSPLLVINRVFGCFILLPIVHQIFVPSRIDNRYNCITMTFEPPFGGITRAETVDRLSVHHRSSLNTHGKTV